MIVHFLAVFNYHISCKLKIIILFILGDDEQDKFLNSPCMFKDQLSKINNNSYKIISPIGIWSVEKQTIFDNFSPYKINENKYSDVKKKLFDDNKNSKNYGT